MAYNEVLVTDNLDTGRGKYNAMLTEVYAGLFTESDTAYVASNGSDSTGVLGKRDKPFLTITAALAAGVAVTSLKIKIGMGTFASPAQANMRANLWLEGSGKPGYNWAVSETSFGVLSFTDPTKLIGGTILQGTLYAQDKQNIHYRDFGVDCGSDYVTGGGTEGNQIAFLSATTSAAFPLIENITIKNVTTLGRTASSAFHAIQLENCYKPIVENCDTYFSTHGIVYKNYGGIINNVRCHKHTSDGIILKSDSYAFGLSTIVSNFEIYGGGGLFIHTGSGTVGFNGANISNGFIRGSATYGVKCLSDIASPNSYLTIHNVKAHGISGIGFDISNCQSGLLSDCYALGCTGDGFNIVQAASNTLTQLQSCHAEGCAIGFDLSATSSSVYIKDCRSRSNSSHGYNCTGSVFGSNNTASGNSGSAINGTMTNIELEQATFFGGTTTPTAVVHIAGSTTTRASLCMVPGTAPSSPVNGDMWIDSTAHTIHVRINGVTKTFTLT